MEKMEMKVFNDVYRETSVLVTGHTGFKGSWLTLWLKSLEILQDFKIIP